MFIVGMHNSLMFLDIKESSLSFLLKLLQSSEIVTQLTYTCSKSKIETLEKGVKYVQS